MGCLIIYAIAYIIGCVAAYFSCKRMNKMLKDDWTIGERNMALFLSFFSWVGFVALQVIIMTIKASSDTRKAKW